MTELNALTREHKVRNEVIINFDELNTEVLPSESHTMNVRGTGQVGNAGNTFVLCFCHQVVDMFLDFKCLQCSCPSNMSFVFEPIQAEMMSEIPRPLLQVQKLGIKSRG